MQKIQTLSSGISPLANISHQGWEEYYLAQDGAKAWNGVPDDFLLQHLDEVLLPGAFKVIDVACGDGRNTVPFLGRGLSVTATDLSVSALQSFSHRCRLEDISPPVLLAGDFFAIDLLPEQFHAAVCFNAISHFPSPAAALQRIVSLLMPGGRACFNAFTTHDVAYGEGEEIGRHQFAYKDTLFTFLDEEDVKAILPQGVKVLHSETRRWREPPHGAFRTAPHTHEASYFIIERL